MRKRNKDFKKSRVFGWIALIEAIAMSILGILTIALYLSGIGPDIIDVMKIVTICLMVLHIPLFIVATHCPYCGRCCIPCRPFREDLGKCRKCDNPVEYRE